MARAAPRLPARLLAVLACLLLWPGAPAQAAELSGTLAKVAESGRLVIGHREASYPFSFVNGDVAPSGYSIDLCLAIAEEVKAALGRTDIEVAWIPVTPETRIEALTSGEIDLECGSTTHTLGRRERVDFTPIVFVTGAKLLVRDGSGIEDLGDLDGKSLALVRGTTTEKGLKAVVAREGLDIVLVEVDDHDEGFAALEEGRVAAYVTDHVLLHGLRDKAKVPAEWTIVGNFLSYEPYAFMYRRDDSAFGLVATRALARLFREDRISEIYRKWFEPLGIPPGELLKAAVQLQALPE